MAPKPPACSFIQAAMAGSCSTAPLNRSNSVLIVAPLSAFSPSAARAALVFRTAGFPPALFLECGGLPPLSPRCVEAGLQPGSFLVTRHSSLTTAVWCRGTVPGDKREVSPTLKVSHHYELNDRYHMNIRKRPSCPRFPLPCRAARNVTLLVPFSCRLCARLWRERDKRPTIKRTIVLSANPRPNVFESHGFENSSCTRGLLRGLQADATFRHCAASGRARCTRIHTGASRCAAARNFILKHTPSSSTGRISGRAARSQRRRRAQGPVYD